MATNISPQQAQDQLSEFITILGQPARLNILLALGIQEACVCHLEALLGYRQAAISQHLSILRKADLVGSRRDGRHIYYSLARPEVQTLLDQIVETAGLNATALQFAASPLADCPCPTCNPGLDDALVCKPKTKKPT